MSNFIAKTILFLVAFILTVKFRKKIAAAISKIPFPAVVLYLLTSMLLIIFEEQINCGPSWCGKVLIPPTLPILIVEVFVVWILTKIFKPKSILAPAIIYAIFGVLWELTIGGLRGISGTELILLSIWTAIGYMFIVIIPLTIILDKRTNNNH